MPDLYQELCKLADSDMYPFHMPGHKRNLESTPMKGAFRCDITEIDGFDNLHDESGIILEAERRANRLYGSDETFFLVNGSTCGVLAALSAVTNEGDNVLAARGSHKSFYHAAYLRYLKISYLPYKVEKKYGIPLGYTASEVEACITDDTKCVFITSPTYEGVCSDVKEIADICHKRGIPLIVDAAHGAHFGFGNLPQSATRQGADLVIHSVHKTLPSMTQTALLHVQGNLVDRNRLKRFLRIYQSSSPSYVLMSSIDLCMKEMEERGQEFAQRLITLRERIQSATSKCSCLEVPGKSAIEDPAKVMIYVKNGTMTGQALYDILREEYNLQLEMAGDKYALAIITGWDTEKGIDRLIEAILDIDIKLASDGFHTEESQNKEKDSDLIKTDTNGVQYYKLPKAEMCITEAWDSAKEVVSLEEAKGRVSAEFVNLYPPGIPIIAPGEKISDEVVSEVRHYMKNGMNVQGLEELGLGECSKSSELLYRKGFLCVRQK